VRSDETKLESKHRAAGVAPYFLRFRRPDLYRGKIFGGVSGILALAL
jgi:hypothetical protein